MAGALRRPRCYTHILEAAGENPEDLMKLIAQGKGAAMTIAGMESSTLPLHVSPVLQQMAADLGKHSSDYLARLGMQDKAALNGLSRAMLLLKADGSPEALKLAMEMKHDATDTLLTRYVETARKRATEASSKIAGDDLLDEGGNIRLGKLEAMSAKADEVVSEHLDRLRSTEVELWTKAYADTSGPVSRKNMVVAYRDIVANRVADPELDVPRTVRDRMENIIEARRVIGQAQQGKEVSSELLASAMDTLSAKRLIRTKSQLLADMVKAARAGDNNQAEMIGRMVQAVDDDLFAGGKITRVRRRACAWLRGGDQGCATGWGYGPVCAADAVGRCHVVHQGIPRRGTALVRWRGPGGHSAGLASYSG